MELMWNLIMPVLNMYIMHFSLIHSTLSVPSAFLLISLSSASVYFIYVENQLSFIMDIFLDT